MPRLYLILLLTSAACATAADGRPYSLDYRATFVPEEGYVDVQVTVEQPGPRLIRLDFNAPAERYPRFEGDGEISRNGRRLIWQVPPEGGELRYRALVDHRRGDAWDARLTERWAVLRLDDLFPPVRARSRTGAYARARLYLDGPDGWSFETPYGPVTAQGVAVDTEGRRFDRPLGWMAAGELGIRRTRIGDRKIAIAGPKDQGFRRMDMLAFLNWTLPELVRVAPSLPDRLLIVGGSQDMWRGGLSGPGSLYVHPDRPLVSGNATSTLLHELMHVATVEPGADGADWIVEGLAEYYSLVVLLRSGGISGSRFQQALERLEDWVRRDDGRLSDPSTGADTARAVLLFRDLDLEVRASGGDFDRITTRLFSGQISIERLAQLVEESLAHPSKVLSAALQRLDEP